MEKVPDLLRQLEALRRQLEDVDHALGNAYDYLDRGLPDDTQRRETWEKIEGWKEEEAHLKDQLTQLVANVRQAQPEVIAAWADLHKIFYGEIQTRYENADGYTVPPQDIANIFIESALKNWELVRTGEKDYVISIQALTSQNKDIYEKIFNDEGI